ncbi:MAG TPA: hypothetical protein VFU02_12265 [Polyangiaceae bacterium]|nr:hypothetical protein [Polyangiaceae bacterium]
MDPNDGTPDSKRSDSTFPFDTGQFRLRRSLSLRWVALGMALASAVGVLGFVKSFGTSGGARIPEASARQHSRQDATRAAEALAAKERQACLDLSAKVRAEAPVPGTPVLDRNRIDLLLRTKLEPVVFTRPPEYDPAASGKSLRASFQRSQYPSTLLKTLTPAFRIRPDFGRGVLLGDGYLYADEPEHAFALVHHVRAEHLYDAERIWIQRGDQTLHAERTKDGRYRYLDGMLRGKEVSLVLFDRVGTGSVPPPIHRDLRSLQYRLHFDRMSLVHLTDTRIVADLRYGGMSVPSVLKADGARLDLECEVVPAGATDDLALYRERGARKQRVVQALRRAMRDQIAEELPFDEPYREWGQQDGVLRYKWRDAYFAGKQRFELNGDDYYVYDPEGHPKLPQVCVDFLTDTLERATGTWWSPLGTTPKRIVGGLDFDTLNNPVLRRASAFVDHAHEHAEQFDVYDTPPEQQIPFWRKQAFTHYLLQNVDKFVPGDIVLIRGQTNFEKKWERPIMHYHSFFIYESDPVSGIPIAIVGNAGVPSLRVWNTEMRRTPRRSIWHRIRPQLHWLESVVPAGGAEDVEPAPLALGRD